MKENAWIYSQGRLVLLKKHTTAVYFYERVYPTNLEYK